MTDDNLAVGETEDIGTEEADDEAKEKEKLKAAIEVTSEDVGTLRRKLTITVEGKYIDERRHDRHVLADRPADAPLDQVVKPRIAEGPLVVPPGGVEDAAFAVGADPGPGFPSTPSPCGRGLG